MRTATVKWAATIRSDPKLIVGAGAALDIDVVANIITEPIAGSQFTLI